MLFLSNLNRGWLGPSSIKPSSRALSVWSSIYWGHEPCIGFLHFLPSRWQCFGARGPSAHADCLTRSSFCSGAFPLALTHLRGCLSTSKCSPLLSRRHLTLTISFSPYLVHPGVSASSMAVIREECPGGFDGALILLLW